MRAYIRGGIEALKGFSAEIIAEWTGVHLSTARRYKRGEMPSFAALKIINLHATGNLVVVHPKWNNWRIRDDGVLIAPHGQEFTPGDVLASQFWQQLAASYQAAQRLPAQGDWIDEKWKEAKEQTAVGGAA